MGLRRAAVDAVVDGVVVTVVDFRLVVRDQEPNEDGGRQLLRLGWATAGNGRSLACGGALDGYESRDGVEGSGSGVDRAVDLSLEARGLCQRRGQQRRS